MEKDKLIIFTVSIFFFISSIVFADEEDIREKHKDKSYKQTQTTDLIQKEDLRDKFKSGISFGATEGYDSNVFLDSSRKGDLFDHVSTGIDLTYRLNKIVSLKAEYDFNSITYHEFTDLSVLDNGVALSLEYYINERIKVKAGYDLDFINYLSNENGDLSAQGPFADIRYSIMPNSYIGAGYRYQFYDYDKRKIRSGTNKTLELTREDHRHSIIGEFATRIGKLFFKVKNRYYFNESNDGYMDYYDYQSDRVKGYIVYPLCESIHLLLKGGYQRKEFKSRKTTTSSSKQEDDLMILGLSLYYEILPSAYINADYTYRQNYSNDPIQEYTGSISSVGFHYSF